MSEIVVRARDLKKVYRLYSGPGYRFLDMFGLLGRRQGIYTEHAALDGISLDIARGEKVAFIGRNGAGKSELLVSELQENVALRDREIIRQEREREHEVGKRDRMLTELQAHGIHEVAIRDAEIASLNERIDVVQRALDRTPGERLKRAWRRLAGHQ